MATCKAASLAISHKGPPRQERVPTPSTESNESRLESDIQIGFEVLLDQDSRTRGRFVARRIIPITSKASRASVFTDRATTFASRHAESTSATRANTGAHAMISQPDQRPRRFFRSEFAVHA